MNYTKIYGSLIERARIRKLDGYYETHHIIPKCMGGDNSKTNLVELTAEEHYLAHQLLVKMYPNNNSLLSAAMMMTASRKGNKVYGWLRRKWSEKMTKSNPLVLYPEKNARMGRRLKGTFSDDERKAISERMKSNNPMKDKLPWEHSRATEESKLIWLDAKWYYDTWKETGWSYHRLAKARGFIKPKGSHMNMVKKFKAGWVP